MLVMALSRLRPSARGVATAGVLFRIVLMLQL